MPLAFSIDDQSYNRTHAHAIGDGYERRSSPPTAIIIHSTNGNPKSTFDGEARYLRDSPNVSTHYLVGKDGQIALIVPPAWAAWHAGKALAPFTNDRSIGVENHHAVGDSWPQTQLDALTWLVRQLLHEWSIPSLMVETHRAVARPVGRKQDPNDWSDRDFYAWRDTLSTAHYLVLEACTVQTAPRGDAPFATGPVRLGIGQTINVGQQKDGWLWIAPNTTDPPGIGFIPSAYARPL